MLLARTLMNEADGDAHLQIRLNSFETSLWDLNLVEVYQRVQERVHFCHHHLCCLPATIFWHFAARRCQDHDCRCDIGHRHHRRAE